MKILTRKGRKNKEGNISILIMIAGMVILLSVSVLAAFVMRDISFSKHDEEKLKALNLAEAGISNFLLEITKYYQGEIKTLPDSPVTGEIRYKNKPAGSYKIDYLSDAGSKDNYYILGYDITSTGFEPGGGHAAINVKISVGSIYNFIFSENSVNSEAEKQDQNSISGPFLTNGTFSLTNAIEFSKGPVLIGGNIIPGEEACIGSPAEPVDLFFDSGQKDVPGDIKNFKEYCQNFEIYLNALKKEPVKIQSLKIDEKYIKEVLSAGAIIVPGNLIITEKGIEPYPVNSNQDNYIKFEDGILKISGNIIVDGNIIFGNKEKPQNIFYEGKGNLISKGDILNYAKIVPSNISSGFFPGKNLLVLTAFNDISFMNPALQNTEFEHPDAACAAISKNKILTGSNQIIRGLFSAKDIYMDKNTKIYYEAGICDALPTGIPAASFIIFNKSWQEQPLKSE